MSNRVVLIAHHAVDVRERFSAALAEGRHASVPAATERDARAAAFDRTRPIHLALLDLSLAEDPLAFVRALRQTGDEARPIVVFAGSVGSAAIVAPLAALDAGFINEHATTPQILPALAPHLFPDSFNRRASRRVAIGLPVSYRVGATTAGAVTLDIGKGGIAVRTISPLPRGTAVRLKFRLPATSQDIDAAGRVVWSDSKVGMGVQFETLTVNDQRAIDAFVDTTDR